MKRIIKFAILLILLFILTACIKNNDINYNNDEINSSEIYKKAISLYDDNKKAQARFYFNKVKEYSDSSEYLNKIDKELRIKSMNRSQLLSKDGKLILPYSSDYIYSCFHENKEKEPNDVGQYPREISLTCNIYNRLINLNGIISLCGDDTFIPLFLMSDGSVKSVYCYEDKYLNALGESVENKLSNVVQMAGVESDLAFLLADGRIVNSDGESVFPDSDYKAVSVGSSHIVGLKKDGTVSVHCTGKERTDQYRCFCDTSEWKNVVMIETAPYSLNIYGITEDGKILVTGLNPSDTKFIKLKEYLSSLTNICYFYEDLNGGIIFFMTSEEVWKSRILNLLEPETKLDDWEDVIDIYSSNGFLLALTNKGTIIGYENTDWASKADELNNIKIP